MCYYQIDSGQRRATKLIAGSRAGDVATGSSADRPPYWNIGARRTGECGDGGLPPSIQHRIATLFSTHIRTWGGRASTHIRACGGGTGTHIRAWGGRTGTLIAGGLTTNPNQLHYSFNKETPMKLFIYTTVLIACAWLAGLTAGLTYYTLLKWS